MCGAGDAPKMPAIIDSACMLQLLPPRATHAPRERALSTMKARLGKHSKNPEIMDAL